MAKSYSDFASLQKAIQKEMHTAFEEAIEESFKDLHENVDFFYAKPGNPTPGNPPPGYDRTGQLAESPERTISGGGNELHGELKLDTSYRYNPSGRDTETIYGYAEEGGLRGHGAFWERTLEDIEDNINSSFGKRFSR